MAGYTAQDIVNYVHSGQGPDKLYTASDAFKKMSDKHLALVQEMQDLQTAMKPHWEGKAADAAYAGVGPLLAASDVSGQHLQKANELASGQGDSFERLKGTVGDGPGPKPDSSFTSDYLPFLTGRDEEIAQWNAEAQKVVDAYDKYANESRVNANSWPDDYGSLNMPPGGADFTVAPMGGGSGGTGGGAVNIPGPGGGYSAPTVGGAPVGGAGGPVAPIPGPGGPAPGPISGPSVAQPPAASAPQIPDSGGDYTGPNWSGSGGYNTGPGGYGSGPGGYGSGDYNGPNWDGSGEYNGPEWGDSGGTSSAGYTDPSWNYGSGGYNTPGSGYNYGSGSGYDTPGGRSTSGFGPAGGYAAGGYAAGGGGFGPRGSSSVGGFGPQGSAGGSGSGSGSGYGAGRSSGAAAPRDTPSAPVRGGAAAAGTSSSSSGRMPYGAMGGAGRGQGSDDELHDTPEYLQEPDAESIFGPDPNDRTVPPVIGE